MVKKLKLGKAAAVNSMAARSDMSIEGLRRTFRDHVFYTQGRFVEGASRNDLYMALSYTVRDQLVHRWIKTVDQIVDQLGREDVKVVAYLSAEFLLGPHLENNLINLGIYENVRSTARRRAKISRPSSTRRRSLALVMEGWAGWRPATSIPLQLSRSLPLGTVSATNSASLNRRFGTAGRWNAPTTGFDWAIHGKWFDLKSPFR